MKVAIYTLGCKMNQYESQSMEKMLRERGHDVVEFQDEADAYIINTCSVTAVSDQKSRQVIHRIQRQRPSAVVAVCGCYPQTHVEEARALGVDLVGGTGDRIGFLDLLEETAREKKYIESIDKSFERRVFEVLPAGGQSRRTRAMLKVEDGCVNFCSYCIIPYARGPVRSATIEVAASQAKQLKEEGYREMVITGIEISSWGKDFKNGQTLIDLLEAIAKAAPGVRIRLGSLEPRTVTEDFCRRAAALPDLCPQFHLSLQSGCDETLKRMNRKYDTARYLESVELLNRYFDRPAITTDLITGFPEETEEEFEKTLEFIQKCAFAQMHIFPYSIRPGTPAAKMKQNHKSVKEDRARRATAIAAAMHETYLNDCVGAVYPVLFEQEKGEWFAGHAPNYMEVMVKGGAELHNQVKSVRITHTDGQALYGEIVEEM
jgi:threonylcarbamoyladenosine tRNA methylthiotransferase MtaB